MSRGLKASVGERCMFSDGFSQFDAVALSDLESVQQRINSGDLAPTGVMAGRAGNPSPHSSKYL